MALKIRLRQQGARNSKKYRLIVADIRSAREGKYLEALGWYDPQAKEEMQLSIKPDRVDHWLKLGAQMSESASALVKKAAPEVVKQYHTRLAERANKRNQKRRAAKSQKA